MATAIALNTSIAVAGWVPMAAGITTSEMRRTNPE
jgi:hypothetical protein